PVVGVVENMSAFRCPCCGELTAPFGHGGGAALAGQLGAPLLAEIPLEPALREGGDTGRPIVLDQPGAQSAAAIRALAERLAAIPPRVARPAAIASPLAVVKG